MLYADYSITPSVTPWYSFGACRSGCMGIPPVHAAQQRHAPEEYPCNRTDSVSVHQSEGNVTGGAWEHGVLQQRAAGEEALDEAAHVCVLMHVGAAQARTRLQERQRVSPAALVRDACHMMPSYTI